MEDSLGLYYLPHPGIPSERMYVRRGPDRNVEFRMWNADRPEVWERHEWLSMSVLTMAAALFREQHANSDEDPLALYDNVVAESLLRAKEGL